MNNLYKKINNKFSPIYSKGLTLIELMVVISIFLVISSTVIFNYGGFQSNISLQNLTDDIALSVRKAQSFAIGARGIGGNFSNSYGMHFSNSVTNANLNSSNKSFLMFSTNSNPKEYTIGNGTCGDGTSNCMELFNITSADYIKTITLNDDGKGGGTIIDPNSYIDIIFTRPEPRATFCYRIDMSSVCNSMAISSVSIKITNGKVTPNEKTKTISIQSNGQISISDQ